MSGHTPGPWSVMSDGLWTDPVICSGTRAGGGHRLATVFWHENALGLDEGRANANLIAAAPELLAACEEALLPCPTDRAAAALGERIRAAVAKARGRPPPDDDRSPPLAEVE